MTTVVVGVSPTSRSVAALEWAADEARRRQATLRAVSAWRVPNASDVMGRPSASEQTLAALEQEAEQLLERAVRAVVGDASGVERRAVRGTPATVLVRESADAQLLVLGPPHPGEVFRYRPNQLALQVIYRAPCPVVVMPPEPHDPASGARRFAARIAEAAATAGRPGLRPPPPA